MPTKNHACKTILRSPKGNRLLVAIATDHNNQELQDVLVAARKLPCYRNCTDEELMQEIETLATALPNKCPECDGKSD